MLPFTIGVALSARKGDVKGLKSGLFYVKRHGRFSKLSKQI